MYEAYFGLREKPFSLTPDPSYLYLSERHREALAHLLYGVREPGGFVQLTGEVGTGKTTVTRALIEELPENVDLALIYSPAGNVRELLAAIFKELDVPQPPRRYSVKSLVDELNDYLLESHARGRVTAVLVDEAQTLPADVIEELRLLTNLETAKAKLLHVILVGQPELRQLLDREELRQVAQRITARFHLEPLSRRETAAYIRHRLAVAGCERPLFTRRALALAHRFSGGVPRLINSLCDRALLGAYARHDNQVRGATVRHAAREIANPAFSHRAVPIGLTAAAAVLSVAAAGWYWFPAWSAAVHAAAERAGIVAPGVGTPEDLAGSAAGPDAEINRAPAE
ncbi:MAG: AAA family ATPase [Ectothiorhodospiraceae bacterium]|jgi:general secretion pathway protein A